ncbi:MAG: D-alanine--D-alanine ligase [Candidatus Falkowbacteria bacterium]
MTNKIKIALLTGGNSNERKISLKSGKKIINAINSKKYQVSVFDLKTDLKKFLSLALAKKFDLIFPALHGAYGEDGKLQGMLEMLGLPYVFSNTTASAIAIDKYYTKLIAKNAGLTLAKDIILFKNRPLPIDEIIKKMGLPLIIKPISTGSSIGISIASNKKQVASGLANAFKHDKKIIIEEFIKGREFAAAIFGNHPPKVLPIVEIIPKISSWFDYKAKYKKEGSQEICPANIPSYVKRKIQNDSLKIFQALGCKDLARADFIWNEQNNKIYFLEINTIPGMTTESLVPKSAEAAGMNLQCFIENLIEQSLREDKNKKL